MTSNITRYADEAATFDCYPVGGNAHLTCLLLGVVAEVGEVVGVLDKHVRKCGSHTPWNAHECETCRPKLLDEIGDVKWYTVRIIDEDGGGFADYDDPTDQMRQPLDLRPVVNELMDCAATCGRLALTANWPDVYTLQRLIRSVNMTTWMLGSSIAELDAHNLAKLSGRRGAP